MKISLTILFTCAALSLCADEVSSLRDGMTMDEVKAVLGEPEGNIASGKSTYLYYAGVKLQFVDGVATNLPADINETLLSAKEKEAGDAAFKAEQERKGLVLYQGEWLTRNEANKRIANFEVARRVEKFNTVKRKVSEIQEKESKIKQYAIQTPDKKMVDHRPWALRGKIAVVVVVLKGAKLSPAYANTLAKIIEEEPLAEIQIRQLDSLDEPFAKKYHIVGSHTVRVIDPMGRFLNGRDISIKGVKDAIDRGIKVNNL